jgi:hypothetical protein
MKHRMAVLVLLIVAGSAAFCQSQSAEFSLSIGVPNNEILAGDRILLTIVMKNITDQDMYWGRSVGEKRPAFMIKITDQHNQLVAQTDYGKEMSGTPKSGMPLFSSAWMDTLPPGKSVSAEVMLDREYDMKGKGTYRIQVERLSPSGVRVKSNEITLIEH